MIDNDNTEITLKDKDCAIVFRINDDDSFIPTLYIPTVSEEESEKLVDPATELCVAMYLMIRGKEGFIEECGKWLHEEVEKSSNNILNK